MQMRMNFTTPLANANDPQSQQEVCVCVCVGVCTCKCAGVYMYVGMFFMWCAHCDINMTCLQNC